MRWLPNKPMDPAALAARRLIDRAFGGRTPFLNRLPGSLASAYYLIMSKLIWQWIDDEWPHGGKPDGFTYRAEVEGGWLVSVWAGTEDKHASGGGLTFVPDPEHKWSVKLRQT